ncbi:MAG: type II toxin-antitoxin system RelE/ParE family toxin [Thaumarchaeota archaeon]|nr:type II toxin-antitoxin system RelE/ParE family toxin [Nitrososphaerota archaeon]
MSGRILYKSSVSRDLKKINPKEVERILRGIRTVLGDNLNAEEPMVGEFKGLFKIRVGDYRVIYTVIDGDVLVLKIGHRSKVYQ